MKLLKSYAQNFEDVILWRALKGVEDGFYVDLGAHDPIIHSVSLAFYEKGWRGVHVEPTPAYAAKLRQARPDEDVIEAAVGNHTGLLTFYEIPGTGLSTGDPALAKKHADAGYQVREVAVPLISLCALLDRYAERDVHWLKIDIEGMEYAAVESLGQSAVRPWIVLVESTLPLSTEANHSVWEPQLRKLGYDFVYFDGLNRFYIDDARPELRAAFGPGPNVFDGFTISLRSASPFSQHGNEVVQRLEAEKCGLEEEIKRLRPFERLVTEFKHVSGAPEENHEEPVPLIETPSSQNKARLNAISDRGYGSGRLTVSDINLDQQGHAKTVVVFSTYPFVEPRHGGQVRLSSIARAYRKSGWNVASIAVYEPESHAAGHTSPLDVPFPVGSRFRLYEGTYVPLITDLLSGHYAAADDGGFAEIFTRLPPQVDLFHVEQVWLWPLVEKLRLLQQYKSTKAVYGSQNIESKLKADILTTYGIFEIEKITAEIDRLERTAVAGCDVALAVTRADQEVLCRWGAGQVILAPNGIDPWSTNSDDLERWRERLPRAPWLLYVGSAHPPNFKDIDRYLGGALGCFPPDSRLVVAGSVSEHVYKELSASRWASLNHSRLQLLFSLSDEDLAAVKTLAHGFILPISVGGGSNIKTAEALYSGSYVVAALTALRGYERFLDLPEVFAANDAFEFRNGIRSALAKPKTGTIGTGLRESLTWESGLQEFIDYIDKI